ncbi:MAG: hypothetical protein AABX05_05845 [Nanoarchaeota archaeon]
MPYKIYQVGDAGRPARLVLQYEESDARDSRLRQRMDWRIDLLVNYLVLAKDATARVSDHANRLTLEAAWKAGDYYLQMRAREGLSQDISCRLLSEGVEVNIGSERYLLKKK